ncbi:TetR/AcrR family transcriptional regulator [Halomonas sp. QX-2]|jgi:TetR/AcrR family transcriptional repressor for divergent bdcA|uniref:TetR/AcrR family transcriptional regulator n=1 Tax=Vreelandella sedimenti TaxID=2729618 RepID=A0A7Z0N8G2_9GAMM|nr:TetR/AcrR family transcriptional regulator [Halomonas sedimenti]NYT73353.1 TetR/AcrR family transcriptional regulator [Halomonas sedimenti]|tara:strand:- start:81 stop:686 length:606 start_codon:yes stop_codon:yes gene_type:complete
MANQSIKIKTARTRRPAFDREQGIETARALFHARGYDAVGIAELTQALDIVPPSLYAAYGSKLALFERTLQSYMAKQILPLDKILSSDDSPAEVLTGLFIAAAKHYTHDPVLRGCMVTEAMRADDQQAAALAATLAKPISDAIHDYVANFCPSGDVDQITDYVLLTLRGLSSYACLGLPQQKLVGCAEVAGRALDVEFASS